MSALPRRCNGGPFSPGPSPQRASPSRCMPSLPVSDYPLHRQRPPGAIPTPFFWTLSGVYLLFVAVAAFAVGGYMTARLRSPMGVRSRETECNDAGLHGLTTWGLAILVTAVLALGGAALTSPAVAPSGGEGGASQSVAGENIIASELDELFPRPAEPRQYSPIAARKPRASCSRPIAVAAFPGGSRISGAPDRRRRDRR